MSADRTSAVFSALADPTRRALLERLVRGGDATATQLSAAFPISRQAVVKHLGALSAAGLLQAQRVGREQRFAADLAAMDVASAWMRDVGGAWDERLAALRHHLAQRA